MRQGLKHLEQRDSIKPAPTNTSVAAYSTRRRPNAPVSVPIAWKELDSGTPPDRFTALTVKARLSRRAAIPGKTTGTRVSVFPRAYLRQWLDAYDEFGYHRRGNREASMAKKRSSTTRSKSGGRKAGRGGAGRGAGKTARKGARKGAGGRKGAARKRAARKGAARKGAAKKGAAKSAARKGAKKGGARKSARRTSGASTRRATRPATGAEALMEPMGDTMTGPGAAEGAGPGGMGPGDTDTDEM
jgi:hypothetical protein